MKHNHKKQFIFTPFWLAIFSIFICSTNTSAIFAQSSSKVTARVTSVKGLAIYSYKKIKDQRIRKGKVITEGYEIRTGSKSRVVINISDGSRITVLSNTRVVFENFEDAKSVRDLVNVLIGKVRLKINKIKNKPNPYRVKTPTASIAVRGTEFEVTVLADGETRVITTEGLVEVYSLRKPDESLFSEPGRGVIVRADFSIDFLNPNLSGRSNKNNSADSKIEVGTRSSSIVSSNSQPAANSYERFSGNVIRSVENFSPSRNIAVANPHFDSLDNPAYAGAFDHAEGQVYFLTGISNDQIEGGSSVADNLNRFVSVDYNVGLQGTFFMPIPKSRLIVGASGSFVLNGLQPLETRTDENSVNLPGTTFNTYSNGSLMVAQTFGDDKQTTVGASYDRLSSDGFLAVTLDQNNLTGERSFGSSRFNVTRDRFTIGIKHNFTKTELGVFYRYGRTNSSLGNSEFVTNNSTNFYLIQTKAKSSEIGFRVRRKVTRKFFYGVEGSLLFEDSIDNVRTESDFSRTLSIQDTNTNRSSIGVGFGYLLRPQTIFTFDINGGSNNGNSIRREDQTGDTIEINDRKSKFASLHAAVQTDIWKGLFGSASVNTFYRDNALDQTFFASNPQFQTRPNGIFTNNTLTQNSVNYTFSDLGLGWRFSPNYIFQYVLTTDYGKTAPRHNFLFRYSFDFGKD